MTPDELKLVPMQDLMDEIFSRTETCVIAYVRQVDAGPAIILMDWRGPFYLTAAGLCDAAKKKILEFGDQHNYPDPGNV